MDDSTETTAPVSPDDDRGTGVARDRRVAGISVQRDRSTPSERTVVDGELDGRNKAT